MSYRDRIVLDPEVRFGKPTVRGTRITVADVLSYLASGMSEEAILADFPQLATEDIRACLAFAAERTEACEQFFALTRLGSAGILCREASVRREPVGSAR